MPIGSRVVRERLLDLFPAEAIQAFPEVRDKMTKAEAAAAVAKGADADDVRNFVASNFGRLHQHVYFFEPGLTNGVINANPPYGVAPFRTGKKSEERSYFYLLRLAYDLVLDNPLEKETLAFAWPLKVVVAPNHSRLHLTIMAKSLSGYMPEDRSVLKTLQRPTERDLLNEFRQSFGWQRLDLNRGIKALWDTGEFDAPSVQYKRPRSITTNVMDEDFTVRAHDPERYIELLDKPLFQTTFRFLGDEPCIGYFVADPTNGSLVFRRYSTSNDCIDDVVRRILAAN
jgi:hypothetical protein